MSKTLRSKDPEWDMPLVLGRAGQLCVGGVHRFPEFYAKQAQKKALAADVIDSTVAV